MVAAWLAMLIHAPPRQFPKESYPYPSAYTNIIDHSCLPPVLCLAAFVIPLPSLQCLPYVAGCKQPPITSQPYLNPSAQAISGCHNDPLLLLPRVERLTFPQGI